MAARMLKYSCPKPDRSIYFTEEIMDKPNKYQAAIDYMNNLEGFNSHNGIHITKLEDTYAEARAELGAHSMNYAGNAHGGLLFSLSDFVGCFAASPCGRALVTQGASFSFLRPASGKYVVSKATPIKVGSQTAIVDVSTYDDKDKLVAKGTFTYHFMDKDF
jgi:acyl-CoA thioesterase